MKLIRTCSFPFSPLFLIRFTISDEVFILVAAVSILMIQNYLGSPRAEMISYSQFKSLLRKGLIADIAIAEKTIEAT